MPELELEQVQDLIFDGKAPESGSNNQPANQQQPAVVDPPKETPAAAPEIDFNAILKEKTNGKYSSLDEVLNLKPVEVPRETKFENEESKALYEAWQSGKLEDVHAYLSKRTTLSGVEKMSAEQKVKLSYQYKYPDLTAQEIELLYQQEYVVDKEAFNETEYEKEKAKADLKLKMAARDAGGYLSQLNKELVLPKIEVPEKDWTEAIPKDVAEYITQVNGFSESFTQAKEKSAPLEKISFSFIDKGVDGKPDEVIFANDFPVTADENKALNEKTGDYWNFISSRYQAEGGNGYDVNKMKADIYKLENFDNIVKAQVKKAIGETTDRLLKEIKNYDGGVQTPAAGTLTDPGLAVIENVILGGQGN